MLNELNEKQKLSSELQKEIQELEELNKKDKSRCVNDKGGKCKDAAGHSCYFSWMIGRKPPTACEAYQTAQQLIDHIKNNP